MRNLVLAFVFVVLLHLPSTSCNRLNPFVLQQGNCYPFPIPFPFAIFNKFTGTSTALPGFEVLCNLGGSPMLQLGTRQYQLLEVSLEGYVRIAGRAFKWFCSSNSAGEDAPSAPAINLDGTPYTFSETRNRFTAIGCDAMAMIVAGSGRPNDYTSGCVSFCPTSHSVINGSCSGVGCCQAFVPRGLKSLDLDIRSIRNMTGSKNVSETCSKAFIVEQSWFNFSTDDLTGNPNDDYRPVVLDWSIGDKNCSYAMKDPNTYACAGQKTVCHDAVVGYRCNCSPGYHGNPYTGGDGCIDIDECTAPDHKHDCAWKCVNIPGSYRCVCPPRSHGDGKKQGTGCTKPTHLEISLGAGLGALFAVVLLGIWAYWGLLRLKRRRLKQSYFMQNGGLLFQQHISSYRTVARTFSREELERATDEFNENRVLGHGGYGTVYRGTLSDGRVVAIKKSKFVDKSQIEQFINEVIILSQIHHKNVVKLLGCCLETEVPLLVYEFISNGTLSHCVHRKTPMSWENRLRIAVETAGALAYLHSATPVPIVHRDVKSANILLDENYTAKVSDFGASRLIPYDQTHVTTLVQGTFGYLDPEYFQTSVLTEKSDVYSFGVVLMELLTREKPISLGRSEEERNLASHFIMLLEEKRLLSVLLDPVTVEEAGENHLLEVANITRRCLNLRAEERPTMKEVAVELNALRRLMIRHAAKGVKIEKGRMVAIGEIGA